MPSYQPGAHVDVTGPTGVLRQYSLCGPHDDNLSYTIAVKKEPASRGGSAALHHMVLPAAANDQICTCVSRARSAMLVLDI